MNLWNLSASDLLIWGIVLHLIADWPLQNDWMANNKMLRRYRWHHAGESPSTRKYMDVWWDRHPAAWVHAGIHGALLAIIFGWVAAPLALVHLIVDTRWPVRKWSLLVRQTQPQGRVTAEFTGDPDRPLVSGPALYDIGTEVRFWTDQVFHIACIALTALLVTL